MCYPSGKKNKIKEGLRIKKIRTFEKTITEDQMVKE